MKNIESVKFCNPEFDRAKLIEIINSFYPIGVNRIGNMYDFFHKAFYSTFEELCQTDHSPIYHSIDNLEKLKQNFFIGENAKYIGIDVPVWINFDIKECRSKIMIIGIDPLRNKKETIDMIDVGTPYAFHVEKIREKHTRQYWDFVAELSKNNAVYLTDTFKVFYYNNGITNDSTRSYNDKNFTHPQNGDKSKYVDIHQEIFAKEYDLIKPDLIISLGHIPRMWFSKEKGMIKFDEIKKISDDLRLPQYEYRDTPILSLPHLSKRNSTKANPFFEQNKGLSKSYADYSANYISNVMSAKNE